MVPSPQVRVGSLPRYKSRRTLLGFLSLFIGACGDDSESPDLSPALTITCKAANALEVNCPASLGGCSIGCTPEDGGGVAHQTSPAAPARKAR